MISTGMTPPAAQGRQVELSVVEIEALQRWHRLEAVLLVNAEESRAHLMRADRLHRMAAGGTP